MHRKQSPLRNFRGGSWDLRKTDRRKVMREIGFPDRRSNERRATDAADPSFDLDALHWVTKSALDE